MEIENSMIVNWWWSEQEYRVPNKRRLKHEREIYEEEEHEADKTTGILLG